MITFSNFDTSNLESNAMVLAVYDIDDTEHLVNIAEVLDEHSVRVDEDPRNGLRVIKSLCMVSR